MELVKIHECLCDRTRLRLLHVLLQGPLCVCHFQAILREPQVKISKHLAYLRARGLVLRERRHGLLARLDAALADLRAAPRETPLRPALREALERAGARILQLMQLDRENEQLILRFSLASARPSPAAATPAPAFLKRVYQTTG